MASNNTSRMRSGIAAGLLCLLIGVPSSLGMAFFVSPPAPSAHRWIAVAKLNDLPKSGAPRLIRVHVPRENAWQIASGNTKTIYVLRSDDDITAFHSYFHSDLRLPIVYDADRDVFRTMCWHLEFDRDGNGLSEDADQPMSMDHIETRLEDSEIMVRF